jgi:hypothetical protein
LGGVTYPTNNFSLKNTDINDIYDYTNGIIKINATSILGHSIPETYDLAKGNDLVTIETLSKTINNIPYISQKEVETLTTDIYTKLIAISGSDIIQNLDISNLEDNVQLLSTQFASLSGVGELNDYATLATVANISSGMNLRINNVVVVNSKHGLQIADISASMLNLSGMVYSGCLGMTTITSASSATLSNFTLETGLAKINNAKEVEIVFIYPYTSDTASYVIDAFNKTYNVSVSPGLTTKMSINIHRNTANSFYFSYGSSFANTQYETSGIDFNNNIIGIGIKPGPAVSSCDVSAAIFQVKVWK